MKEIKAYKCDFCKKYLKTKRAMKQHEKICCYNVANKACITCKHFSHRNRFFVASCRIDNNITERLRYGCEDHESE